MAIVENPLFDRALTELMSAVHRGCRASFTRLVALTRRRLLRVVLGINTVPAEAEEILQEVYLKAWQQCRQFDAGKGPVLAWLTVIARHGAIDSLRRRGVRPQGLGDSGVGDGDGGAGDVYAGLHSPELEPLEHMIRARSIVAVQRSLRVLSPHQRESLMLSFDDGLSHAEIAGRLGQPLGTVKSWMRRSLVTLRPVLRGYR